MSNSNIGLMHQAMQADDPTILDHVAPSAYAGFYAGYSHFAQSSFLYEFFSAGCFRILDYLRERGVDIAAMSPRNQVKRIEGEMPNLAWTESNMVSVRIDYLLHRHPASLFYMEEHLHEGGRQGIECLYYGDHQYFSDKDCDKEHPRHWTFCVEVARCFRDDAIKVRLLKQALSHYNSSESEQNRSRLIYLNLHIGCYYDMVIHLLNSLMSSFEYSYYQNQVTEFYQAALDLIDEDESLHEITHCINQRMSHFIPDGQFYKDKDFLKSLEARAETLKENGPLVYWQNRIQIERENVVDSLMGLAKQHLELDDQMHYEVYQRPGFFSCFSTPISRPIGLSLHHKPATSQEKTAATSPQEPETQALLP